MPLSFVCKPLDLMNKNKYRFAFYVEPKKFYKTKVVIFKAFLVGQFLNIKCRNLT